MTSIPSQVAYHLVVNNIAPLLASSVTAVCSTYFTPSRETVYKTVYDTPDEEKELDLLQMDRLLIWMKLVFDTTKKDTAEKDTTEKDTTKEAFEEEQTTAYKRELWSIYRSICSDYKEYERWKKYNGTLWLMSSYRKKNMKPLAKKILSDMKLFHEGLKLLSMIKQVNST